MTFGGIAALLALVACGSDFKGDGHSAGAAAGCREFVSAWCTETVRCAVDDDLIDAANEEDQLDQCVDTGTALVDCDNAVALSSDYEDCLDSIHQISCEPIVAALRGDDHAALPDTCERVIEVSE